MGIKNNLKRIRMNDFTMERKEFAEFIGIQTKTYYGWENGASFPTLEKALAIAKKLDKRVDEIWYLE